MASSQPQNSPPDITPIRRLIGRTVRLLRSSWVATGLGLTVGLGLGTLVTLALLDLALPLATALRVVALVLVVAPALWAFGAGVVRPLVRRLRPVQVARRIEGHLPGIHNRLVSCIDLDTSVRKRDYSPEFYRRLVQEAIERIKGFRPSRVVDGRSLRRSVGFAALSLVAFGLAFGLLSDRLPTALARIFSPLADIPPASGVVYSVAPGDARVLRGEDVTFTVDVERGDPERLRLELRPVSEAKTLRYDLEKVEPRRWRFTLTGFESSFEYRVVGGGTWSIRKRITLVERPTIVGLHTVVHFPEYMGLPEPRVGPPQVADVTGPVGSAVEVIVEAEGDVAEGEIQLIRTRTKQVPAVERPERIWFQDFLPAGAHTKGEWTWDFRLLARPAHTQAPGADFRQHEFTGGPKPFPVRAGESLFAYVYLKPGQAPDMVVVKWFDGSGWEHRAYWGADKLPQSAGKPGTASRRYVGPLPTVGEWVRLEVPARLMDLEGKDVRGMSFGFTGGRCYWHRAGTLPPSHVDRPEPYVAATFPMGPESAGRQRWSGRFPLDRDTLYRVELRNELGHPNKPMKDAKASAIPDNPPQVVLERPGSDLVLSTPIKVPLTIAAFDDFGLADIVVAVQRGDSGGFIGRPVQHYARPERSDTVLASLDVPSFDLKPGEHVRYRVEARDRKGQSAQTQEYVVRIAADDNAADKQLENFDRSQDTFRENLVKLIAEQAKVQESIKAVSAHYAPIEDKVKAAQAEADAERLASPDAKATDPRPQPKLDPETAKQLDELRKELARLAGREEHNARLGEQVETGLKQAAEQAENLKLLPAEMLHQLQGVQQEFQARAVEPLHDLAAEMKQGADPKQPAPDLAAMQREADRLQKDLEAVKNQLEAASQARKDLPRDADAALEALRQEMLRENAGLTARELEELREFLKAREDEIKKLEGQQADLAEATPKAPELILPDIEKRQRELDPKEEQALEDARALLDAEKLRRLRRDDPDFPAAPFQPGNGEEMVPPKEEDPAEPADMKDAPAEGEHAAPKDEQAEDEPLFLPALGGPKPKLDPRFADKLRPLPPKDAAKKGSLDARREALHEHQQERLQELDTARQALASDEQTLAGLLNHLQHALDPEGPEAALNQALRDPTLRQALALAQRSQRLARSRSQPRSHPARAQATTRPDQKPMTDQVGDPNAPLAGLDLATRTLILKMQPQMREELLQGLREEGPEGYKAFIHDYFKRLTQVKGTQ